MSTPSVPASQGAAGYGPHRLAYAAAFVARYCVTAPLVVVKDQTGRNRHCYRGELLDYLNDEQREHFLRKKLIEPVAESLVTQNDSPRTAAPIADPDAKTDLVAKCIADLTRLGVSPDSGAPSCRIALRDAGLRYANDVIAAAVRAQKERLPAIPGTVRA